VVWKLVLLPASWGSHRPRMEKSHSCWPQTVWYVVNMCHKYGMRPLIIVNGTMCYSILYCNSQTLYIRLKYTYSVISVIKLDWLQPIPLGVTFSKAQSSKLESLFCHVSVRGDVRALSFERWNSILKYHPKWDRLYLPILAIVKSGKSTSSWRLEWDFPILGRL